MKNIYEVLDYFPSNICNLISNTIKQNKKIEQELQEIRIRCKRPIILKSRNIEIIIEYKVNEKEILSILERLCNNSIYAYKNQICEGFITVKGGHRVGITGTGVIENGKIINIKYITSLNFRIARQVIGCSKKVLPYILNIPDNSIYNTIILSPPGRGKTTLLRDSIRSISSGMPEYGFRGLNVGVVDERGEIAAMYKGVPQNDLGDRADILDNVSKALGMRMLVRSMSPRVIVADEIGTSEDVEAINYAVCSGVKGLFSAHGSSLNDIAQSPILGRLYEMGLIERIILIENNRSISLVYEKNNK